MKSCKNTYFGVTGYFLLLFHKSWRIYLNRNKLVGWITLVCGVFLPQHWFVMATVFPGGLFDSWKQLLMYCSTWFWEKEAGAKTAACDCGTHQLCIMLLISFILSEYKAFEGHTLSEQSVLLNQRLCVLLGEMDPASLIPRARWVCSESLLGNHSAASVWPEERPQTHWRMSPLWYLLSSIMTNCHWKNTLGCNNSDYL